MFTPNSVVFLESYYEPMAANLARTRLEAAGIPCFLSNEHLVSLLPLYSPITGGVRLHLRQRDVAAALEILRDKQPVMAVLPVEMPAPDAAKGSYCPQCGSDDVAYGPATRNTYSFWSGLLSILLRYPVRSNRFHCFHCGHEFK